MVINILFALKYPYTTGIYAGKIQQEQLFANKWSAKY